jgi:hypothetical protein
MHFNLNRFRNLPAAGAAEAASPELAASSLSGGVQPAGMPSTHVWGRTPRGSLFGGMEDQGAAVAGSAMAMQAAHNAQTILWIDGIGGYLLWQKPELVLGQAFGQGMADVGIVGDVNRQAASVRRIGGDYLLQPFQSTRIDGQQVERPQLLRDGAVIELGASVKLVFRRPNPLSATARLELHSIHRWRPTVDAVLLVAECCLLGNQPGSHIPCRDWNHEMVLIPKGEQWQLKSQVEMLVDGTAHHGAVAISRGMRVRGEDFSLSLE